MLRKIHEKEYEVIIIDCVDTQKQKLTLRSRSMILSQGESKEESMTKEAKRLDRQESTMVLDSKTKESMKTLRANHVSEEIPRVDEFFMSFQ